MTPQKVTFFFILTFLFLNCVSQCSYVYSQTVLFESGDASDSAIAWSPDSSEIAIGTERDGLIVIQASDGKIAKNFGSEQLSGIGNITGVAWSSDGKQLAFARVDGGDTASFPSNIWIIDRDGEKASKITNSTIYTILQEDSKSTKLQSIYYDTPNWSPDGRYIFLTVRTIDRTEYEDDTQPDAEMTLTVAALDLETGKMETLSQGCCPAWSNNDNKLLINGSYDSGPRITIDYDKGSHKPLPDTKAEIPRDQQLVRIENENSKKIPGLMDHQYVSTDGKKVLIKTFKKDELFEYIIKDANVP